MYSAAELTPALSLAEFDQVLFYFLGERRHGPCWFWSCRLARIAGRRNDAFVSSLCHFVAKLSATGIAGIWQNTRVNPTVYEVGDSLSEALATGLTDKRSLTTVDSLVVLQGGQLLERPAAHTAGVRLLVGVVEHVLVVGLLEGEGLAPH